MESPDPVAAGPVDSPAARDYSSGLRCLRRLRWGVDSCDVQGDEAEVGRRCPDDGGDDRQEPSCCVEPQHGADRSHRIRVGSTARRSPASTTPVLEPGFYVSGSAPCSASSPGWAM
jgi:hypothetical protein